VTVSARLTVNRIKRAVTYLLWAALGSIASATLLLYIQSLAYPDLQPWHTEKLTAEFSKQKLSRVSSFNDYLLLEKALFAQLETGVYAQTVTTDNAALARYSPASSANPLQYKPNWNRSFEFAHDSPVGGVLLLHGMSDSPYSLRAIGEKLGQLNYHVVGLRLPGHGTMPSGLTSVSWHDMAAAVDLAMKHLVARVGDGPVHIIGYSTGASLALDFTLKALGSSVAPLPSSLVLISPAIGISPAAALATWKRRLSMLPGLQRLAWLEVMPEFDPYKYNSFATNAGEQVYRLTQSVAGRIAQYSNSASKTEFPPILVLKSAVDATVSTDAVIDRLMKQLPANKHELVLFDINRHAMKSTLLVSDPAPLTMRIMSDDTLPFGVTLIGNENAGSRKIIARHKTAFSDEISKTGNVELAWPRGVISLSHVALPFPPQDPLYGQYPPEDEDVLFLGQMSIQGERGLMKISPEWLIRLRHNPFYEYLERRVLHWLESPGVYITQ
jgi:alpha-beta hydrolase superfamily lysophospholipase